MIKCLNRNQLDTEKYNICISNAVNSRIYAYSWYLDSVCDDWDVLVEDDYQLVMPLPKRKKMGIQYIYQAPWIQQLGVFSTENIDESIIEAFINAIPKKFKLIDIFFNTENRFSSKYVKERTNYLLALNLDFEKLKNNYNKNRKRVSKIDFSNFSIDKEGDVNEFLSLYQKQETNYKMHKDTFEKLQKLARTKNEYTNVWNVYMDDALIAGLFWIIDDHRITYLAPIATVKAKKANIPTYIVNQLIKAYENTHYILDFEGSMIDGVAKFYKSFGAKNEIYFQYKKYHL